MRRLLFSLLLVSVAAAPASAGYREDFAREFMSKTWAGERIEENACIGCHASDTMKASYRLIVDEWKRSWHAQNNVACHDCHGGDPKDPALSMTHLRGFVGKPAPRRIPDFCGRCHIGIVKQYNDSGHGKALRMAARGPHCVDCHGAHDIRKASIEIISEQRCSACHTYGRARDMKQALFVVEKKIGELEDGIRALRQAGIYPDEEERALFSTQAEFRTLFHSVDVDLVKERTDEFTGKLDGISEKIAATFIELRSRKNFSAFLMALFSGMAVVMLLLSRTPKE